jgi:hypothetical protein
MDLSFRDSLVRANFFSWSIVGGGFSFGLVVCFLWGCLPEPLDVDRLPVVKPQIVVSSQIIPDQSLVILLTKTFGALDASNDSDPEELLQQIAVDDAVVKVTGPDGTYDLEALENGLYGGLVIPFEEGAEYTLHVQSESLGEVSATTIVKPMVSFDDIKAELIFNGYDDTLAQITYRITDGLEQNWYLLNVQEVEQADVVENLINPRAFTRLLEDSKFNGETYQETFRVFPRDFIPGDTIAVSLSNISKEYYDFMNLRLDNRYTFVEYLSEPVNYPSNVVGGKGFFNLYVPDFKTFILEY